MDIAEPSAPNMEDTKIENADSTNSETSQEEVLDEAAEEEVKEEAEAESETEDSEEADTKVSKEEYEKLKKEKDELYIQLKKAKAAKDKTRTEVRSNTNLSTKDTMALIEAKVSSEDIDDVAEYAKFKGISVSEALKTSVVKTLLKERAEERQTANATNTGGSKRGTSKVSDDTLLEKARGGEMPSSDADLDRLARARMERMKGKQ